ncbi:MAG TPA: metalloregulator ArsR/SmtB family transcription factor [Planctomycetota bacterium]|jgi:ArsR family transcriptional regulator
MQTAVQIRMDARARILKAMAHPSRLAMLEELSKGERCVCELTALVGADMSTVSKHLSMLQNVGLVLSTKRGSQVFYRLRVPCVQKFMECVEAVLKVNIEAQMATLR